MILQYKSNTLSHQVLISKYCFPLKKIILSFMEQWLIPGMGQKNYKVSLEAGCPRKHGGAKSY